MGKALKPKGLILFVSLFFLLFLVFSSQVAAGNNYALETASNYNIRYDGTASGDTLGDSVIGDVNGDGDNDLVLEVDHDDNNGTNSGSVYVIFGGQEISTGNKLLNSASNYDIRYDGATPSGQLMVGGDNSIGDLNGDNENDLVIVCPFDDNNGNNSGSIYVIFGGPSIATGNKPLNNAANYDIRYDGAAASDQLGSGDNLAIGDLNGDNYNDLVLGAATKIVGYNAGSVYVIFGGPSIATGNKPLNNAANYDIRYDGTASYDYLDVGDDDPIGDLNGDNENDLVMEAASADKNGSSSGSAWVIFGGPSIATGDKPLNNAANYDIRYDGAAASDLLTDGDSVMGDLNSDNYNDLVLGASRANNVGTDTGSVYVIFGGPSIATGDKPLNNAANYDIRYDGVDNYDYLGGYDNIFVDDLNGDGGNDLIMGAIHANNNGITSGSVYVIFGGSSIALGDKPLSSSSNYDIRYDGGEALDEITSGNIDLGDLNSDGYDDLVLGSRYASNSYSEAGSAWVIYGGPAIATGNRPLDNSNNYHIRYDGAYYSDNLSRSSLKVSDINSDGRSDLIMGTTDADNNGSLSGSVWVIFNFPHTLTLNSSGSPTNSVNLTGSVSASNSVTNINGVHYQLDSNSVLGTWIGCDADDGSFDSTSENYTCSPSSLSNGDHTLYLRASDANSSLTLLANYASINLTFDGTLPTAFDLVSPGHEEYLTDSRPTFKWKAASTPDAGTGISHYKFEVKYQDGGGFIVDNIPPSGTANNETEKYLIKYEGFSDSDNTNNYLSLQTKFSSSWGECEGKLKSGTNNWSVRAVDHAGNEREQARIVYFGSALTPTPTPTSTSTPRPKILVKEPSLETEIIKEEKIPAETEEEKERIKEEGYVVQVKVVDEQSNPIKGAKVTLYSEPKVAYTDENGIATFKGADPGEHRVLISYDGKEGEQKINLTGDIQEFHFDIQVKEISPFLSNQVIIMFGFLLLIIGLLLFFLFRKEALVRLG